MTQAIDIRFELLFLACVLASLVLCATALGLMLRRRRSGAKRLLKGLAIGWAAYLLVVFSVAAVTPQRIIPMQQDLCFDEMCFAVVNVQTYPKIAVERAKGSFYVVSVRVSNRGRGRAQSERGLYARLYSRGQQYPVSAAGQRAWDAAHPENIPLTTRVRAGESVFSDQVFDIPTDTSDVGLVLSNGLTPAYFVIGECPLFHTPTVLTWAASAP